MTENREVKSDVFSMLMEDKKNALEVFNILNGSDYQDPELVEIKTLEKGISLTIRNDAAFIIDMNLNIYEHQSTYNPNMPTRALIYVAEIIKEIITNTDLFSRSKVLLPTPRFVVFYNGKERRPEEEELRLSDLFQNPTDNPELELICKVYNINSEKFPNVLDRCSVLKEYTEFIDKVREFELAGCSKPIESAIDWCVGHHILEQFLQSRKPEVLKAMTLDMTFEHREVYIKAEAKAEGKAEDIIELLLDYGSIPNEILLRINEEKNLDVLSRWLKLASRSNSLEEFISKMDLRQNQGA